MKEHNTFTPLKARDVSVVIPVYNRAQLVRRAIDSVLAQTRPPLEIILVDDGSTDDTLLTLKQYGSKIRVIQQEHSGVSAARNRGMRLARGTWIALLDSDDEWLPKKLALAEDFSAQHPEFLIFQSEEIWIRKGQRVNPKKKHQKFGGWIFRQSLPLCIVSPSAVIFHKRILQETGFFDESFPVCEDYDLWLRVARRFPIGLDKRPGIIKYGGHEDQLSHRYWGMDYFRVLAMEKHVHDARLSADLKEALIKEMVSKLEILLTGYRKRGKSNRELETKFRFYRDLLRRLTQKVD